MKYFYRLLPIILFLVLGDSYAGDTKNFTAIFVGNPMDMINDLNSKLAGAGAYSQITNLAMAIAIAGFFYKLYAAIGKNNMSEIRGTIIQAIGVTIMLSATPMVHSAIVNSWQSSYKNSNAHFASTLDSKIQDAKVQMGKMISTTATASTLATTGAVYAGVKLAGAEVAATSVAGKAGMSALGKIGTRLSAAAMALTGFTIMYSSIIAIAAFIVMVLGYVLPIAIALTMWGQTTPIWTCVGSALGAIMITAMMPLLAYSAIDRAFIKPVAATQAYMQSIGLDKDMSNLNASLVKNDFNNELKNQMEACIARQAQATGPTEDCADEKSANVIQKAYTAIANKITPYLEQFNTTVKQLFSSVVSAIVQVILSVLYFIAALVIMGAAVNFLITILGGVSSYAGAVAKGGGQ